MGFKVSATMLVLFINFLILIALALYYHRRRSVKGGHYFILLLYAIAVWSLMSFFEELAATMPMKIFWAKLSYAGSAPATPLLFLFIVIYCGLIEKVKPVYHLILWFIPIIVFLGALTNELHGLVWPSVLMDPDLAGHRAVYAHGPLKWVLTIYSYLLLLGGVALFIQASIGSPRLFRRQYYAIVLSTIFPFLGSLAYLTEISPPGVELAPVMFGITGLFITLSINRYQLLDITPIAYPSLFKSMSGGVLVLDNQDRIVNFNPAFNELFKLNHHYFGKHISHIPQLEQQITKQLREPEKNHTEIKMHGEGVLRWLSINASPIENLRKQKVGSLYTISDITSIKQAQKQIREQNQELEKLNAMKDRFLSIMAHDLRGPFTSILGMSELLVEQINNKNYEEVDEYAAIVRDSSKLAYNLLCNLLEWSQMQWKGIEYNPEYFELTTFISEVATLFSDNTRQKSIRIHTDTPSEVPVFADKDMMGTVLRNLVSNAIKFTHQGGQVTIKAIKTAENITLSVADNGMGMSQERLSTLFLADQVSSFPDTSGQKGTGLGLILCKEFVEKHGGKIWADSVEQKGSVFFITLPCTKNNVELTEKRM